MSGTTITIAIFVAICFCVGLIYLSQARERAKIEKIRKINTLAERHRRMQQLLHDLPPQYLNNELRILISERSVETVNELGILKSDDRLKHQGAQEQEFLKALREKSPEFKPVMIQDEAKAKDVRLLLETLSRFVQNQQKLKRLDANSANKYLSLINFSICQSKADLFSSRADAASKAGKPRVAIHNYHSAIEAFKTLSQNPSAVKAINTFKARIKALEAKADQQNNNADAGQKQDNNEEWDNFLTKDESWHKKNNYDD